MLGFKRQLGLVSSLVELVFKWAEHEPLACAHSFARLRLNIPHSYTRSSNHTTGLACPFISLA